MSKKGVNLSLETIAVLILVLLVLVILAIAFREQISGLFTSFTEIIRGTTDSVSNVDITELTKLE